MKRRIAAMVMIALGATFIIITFTGNLFSVGPAFDRMSSSFKPVMTQTSIAAARSDLTGLGAAVTELRTKAMPAIAGQLKMSPAAFDAYVSQNFPAVAKGLQVVPAASQQFGGVLTTLDNERARFTAADQIPTAWLPAASVPWLLLVAGIVAILSGLLILRTKRAGSRVAFLLALFLVIVPLLTSLPHKAASADTMNSHLAPVYTQQMITGADASLTTLQAMGNSMQTAMLPALATTLHMSAPQMQQFLSANFPALAAGIANMPSALTRFGTLVATFETRLADYNVLKPAAFVPIVWLMIIAGVLIGGFAVWGRGEERSQLLALPHRPAQAA